MKLLIQMALVLLPLALSSNANARNLIEQDYPVKDVREVHVSSGIKLKLTQGDTESLRLKAPAEMLKQIHVDLTNNTLRLSVEKKFSDISTWFTWDEVVFTLAVKNLHMLDLSGGVDADIGNLTLDTLKIKASGGSDSHFESLNAKEIDVEASGGSDVKIKTTASESVRLNVSGGSDFEVEDNGTT